MSKMRNNEEWMELLARAVDGDLRGQERVDLENALPEDPELAAFYERMLAVKSACAALGEDGVDAVCPGLEDKVIKCLDKARTGQVWLNWGMAAAASLVMVAGIGRLVVMQNPAQLAEAGEASSVSTEVNYALQQPDSRDFVKAAVAQAMPSNAFGDTGPHSEGPRLEETKPGAPQVITGNTTVKFAAARPADPLPDVKTAGAVSAPPAASPRLAAETAGSDDVDVDADAPPVVVALEPESGVDKAPAAEPAAREDAARLVRDMVAETGSPNRVVTLTRGATSFENRSGYRAVASRQSVDPAPARGPVRLIRYFNASGSGMVAYAWMRLDKNLSVARFQALMSLMGEGVSSANPEEFMPGGAEPLPSGALVLRMAPHNLVQFLSNISGPTPDQLWLRPATKARPVLLTEMLPEMAPEILVAITPSE